METLLLLRTITVMYYYRLIDVGDKFENPKRDLPGSIFGDLVNLVWLDVRNNKLEKLPSQIGESNSLRDILLGKNKNSRNNNNLAYRWHAMLKKIMV